MTLKEIAKLAGVSSSTVSKIVNGKDKNINSKTRSRVLDVVKEYNYTPYASVKNLNKAKNFTLALLLNHLPPPSLMKGVFDEATSLGYNITLYDSKNSAELELKNITSICRVNIDGVIWLPVNDDSVNFEHYLREKDIAVCYIRQANSNSGFSIDFCGLGYQLTTWLIQKKHNKIACLLCSNEDLICNAFEEGYKKSLYDNHLPYEPDYIMYKDDANLVSKIVTQGISGLICPDYSLSLDLYKKMDDLNYRIPFNLSLISLKDDYPEEFNFPHISTVIIPYVDFCRYVCNSLINTCEKKPSQSVDSLFKIKIKTIESDSIDIPYTLRSKKITVVGSINIDLTYNVDYLPHADKTTQILNSASTLGGNGANRAIAVSRLNHEATLIGAIGNDIESDFIFDFLRQENVRTEGINRNLKIETGKAHIYIDGKGKNTVTILPGANRLLSSHDVDNLKHLFINTGFCLLSTDLTEETVTTAARIAKKCGALNILKPTMSKHLPMELVKYIDIFIPNYREASMLQPTATSTEELADYFYNLGIPTVIITLGHNGCYLKNDETTKYYPAVKFSPIDTIGGADAFIATLATYLTNGYIMDDAIKIATYAAGLCISRQGVIESLVNKNTLEAHIKRQEPQLVIR